MGGMVHENRFSGTHHPKVFTGQTIDFFHIFRFNGASPWRFLMPLDPQDPEYTEQELGSSDSPFMTKIVIPLAVLGVVISLIWACAGEFSSHL